MKPHSPSSRPFSPPPSLRRFLPRDISFLLFSLGYTLGFLSSISSFSPPLTPPIPRPNPAPIPSPHCCRWRHRHTACCAFVPSAPIPSPSRTSSTRIPVRPPEASQPHGDPHLAFTPELAAAGASALPGSAIVRLMLRYAIIALPCTIAGAVALRRRSLLSRRTASTRNLHDASRLLPPPIKSSPHLSSSLCLLFSRSSDPWLFKHLAVGGLRCISRVKQVLRSGLIIRGCYCSR